MSRGLTGIVRHNHVNYSLRCQNSTTTLRYTYFIFISGHALYPFQLIPVINRTGTDTTFNNARGARGLYETNVVWSPKASHISRSRDQFSLEANRRVNNDVGLTLAEVWLVTLRMGLTVCLYDWSSSSTWAAYLEVQQIMTHRFLCQCAIKRHAYREDCREWYPKAFGNPEYLHVKVVMPYSTNLNESLSL